MVDEVATFSRLDLPYVYFAFSQTANRNIAKVGQYYVGKVGYSGGRKCPFTNPLDRIGALNLGAYKVDGSGPLPTWKRTSDPLLGAADWDVFLWATCDNNSTARDFEHDVHSTWRSRGMGDLDWAVIKRLQGGSSLNGINDLVRISPEWLSANEVWYDAAVAQAAGDPLATAVLDTVCDYMRQLVAEIILKSNSSQPFLSSAEFSIDSVYENPTGVFRLHESGPLLSTKPLGDADLESPS